VNLPTFLYGTAWKEEETERLVRLAIDAGFRGIDTANQRKHYFEAGAGTAIADAIRDGVVRRDELFIQTKFTPIDGQDPSRIPYDIYAPLTQQVQQSFAVSQRNLHTDTIDSLLLHSPLSTYASTLEVWRVFESLHDQGLVGHIGISNIYDPRMLERLYKDARVKPSVVQNRFYDKSNFDRELRAFCRSHSITYESFWTLTGNPDYYSHPIVIDIAQRLRKTPEQVWMRFCQHLGIVPLSGTTSEDHMNDDLALASFALTLHDVQAIAHLIGEKVDAVRD